MSTRRYLLDADGHAVHIGSALWSDEYGPITHEALARMALHEVTGLDCREDARAIRGLWARALAWARTRAGLVLTQEYLPEGAAVGEATCWGDLPEAPEGLWSLVGQGPDQVLLKRLWEAEAEVERLREALDAIQADCEEAHAPGASLGTREAVLTLIAERDEALAEVLQGSRLLVTKEAP